MLRTLGLLIWTVLCDGIIVAAGGGLSFLRRPVGLIYLVLWNAWWLAIAWGRPAGVASTYNRSQRRIMILGVVALLGLIAGPPYEYAHLNGPLPRDGWLAWLGLLLFGVGIGLQIAAFFALRGLYTSRLGIQPGHQLVTHGPYRFLRHPGYLSNLLCMAGLGLALSSLIALGLTLAVVPLIVRRIAAEEAMLVAELGAGYETYRRHVRWRLLPGIY